METSKLFNISKLHLQMKQNIKLYEDLKWRWDENNSYRLHIYKVTELGARQKKIQINFFQYEVYKSLTKPAGLFFLQWSDCRGAKHFTQQ